MITEHLEAACLQLVAEVREGAAVQIQGAALSKKQL
jgi:hypothetical protein